MSRAPHLAEDLGQTAHLLSKERERPTALLGALTNISQSLGQAVRRTQQSRNLFVRYRLHSVDMGRRLSFVVGEEIAELEKDALYLESLMDRQRLE